MTEQEIKAIISEVRQMHLPDVQRSIAVSGRFKSLYHQLFPYEDLCRTCPGKMQDAYYRVLNLHPITIQIMTKQDLYFLICASMTVTGIKGIPEVLTNHNLTDEIAEKVINTYPAKAKFFKKRQLEPVTPVVTPGSPEEKKMTVIKTAADEIQSSMTIDQIRDELTHGNVEFTKSENKTSLSKKLADHRDKPAVTEPEKEEPVTDEPAVEKTEEPLTEAADETEKEVADTDTAEKAEAPVLTKKEIREKLAELNVAFNNNMNHATLSELLAEATKEK